MVTKISDANPSAGGSSANFGKDCNPPESCKNCVGSSALSVELTEDQLQTLCDAVEVHTLSKGETLISEGEQDSRLFAVSAGEFEVSRKSDSGKKIVLHHFKRGNLMGELAFLDDLRRTATVQATENACVVSIHRNRLEEMLSVDPWIAYRVMRAVVRSAHGTVGKLDTSYTDFVRYVSS